MDTTNSPDSIQLETATLGGGCFWCLEAIFKRVPGVHQFGPGYAGGHVKNPTYRQVCEGTTGHAEVIQVTFDPAVLSYEALVDLFWEAHDPTTLNRQGPDSGTQYRSVIYTHNDAQQAIAEASRTRAAARFTDPIVTEILPLDTFYPAEDYHQDYYDRNPTAGYCVYVIQPKIEKLTAKGKIG
ncbi:MAG: peptide-methionine (S)-S-oxide reductase MsrA [Opitutaceae bacterium]